jgi:hypothetical protein
MTLYEYHRAHPRRYIAGESGNYLVEVCDNRAWRYVDLEKAKADMAETCYTRGCSGPETHRLIVLEEFAPKFQEIGWE